MTKLVMTIELDYDAELMHGDDQESKDWFFNQILCESLGELMLHSNDMGDTVGTVRVISVTPTLGHDAKP
jgi:hypothetical protein